FQKLTVQFSGVPNYGDRLARNHYNLAGALGQSGQTAKVQEAFQEASTLWKKLAENFPDRHEYQGHAAYTYGQRGDLLAANRQPQEAVKAYQEAITLWEKKLKEDFLTNPDQLQRLAYSYQQLAAVLKSAHQIRDAEEVHRRAMQFYEN